MYKLLGNLKKGLLFVISAPAGTGKTTLAQMLCKEFPCVVESISYTTRPMRGDEKEGEHYHFVSEKEFEKRKKEGDFLECASFLGNHYGTSRSQVEGLQKKGKHILLVIDTQGAQQLRGKVQATSIFISPPNLDELKQRLMRRRTESPEAIARRLEWAQEEMKSRSLYDYHIVNDNLEIAYGVLRSILIAEEHKETHERTTH
ncbi:MAG: guanylate kinase [Verrucomicrobia bacterium]|nr:guanylate kinase [Verrucomicrobiota bacterium]